MKDYLNFEQLNKTEAGKLLGGFSQTFTADADGDVSGANNCQDGNCKTGCHNRDKKRAVKNIGTVTNNCGAGKNCAHGCGKKY